MATVDIELANWALDEARRKGASAAEVLCVTAESLEAGVRMGEVEKLKSSRERRLGVARDLGLVARLGEERLDRSGERSLVVHDEDRRPRHALLP